MNVVESSIWWAALTEDGAIASNRKWVRGRDSVGLDDVAERVTLSQTHSSKKEKWPDSLETVWVHSTALNLFYIVYIKKKRWGILSGFNSHSSTLLHHICVFIIIEDTGQEFLVETALQKKWQHRLFVQMPNYFLLHMFSWQVIFSLKVCSGKTQRHRQTTNSGLVGQLSIIREKNEYLLVLLAPAAGIQQLVAISSWRQNRFHCKRIKKQIWGYLGWRNIINSPSGCDGKQVRLSQRPTGAAQLHGEPATDDQAETVS